ncbi:MAG: acyl-CoA thioesterase [Endozoicomonas sp.]|uniref:acyl-CoA thioesterase n=1 Tax=Endozoicomonas sp. TaxID=1892382 RepID=UPI003D9BA202
MKRDVHPKSDYRYFKLYNTRWNDNDQYGHMNNAHYYAYFDSTIGHFLINECDLNTETDEIVGYVVHSQCNYVSSVAYPDDLEIGLRVNKIGNSSVEYGLAVYRVGQKEASAHGTFTHVFVDRRTHSSAPIPDHIRMRLKNLQI